MLPARSECLNVLVVDDDVAMRELVCNIVSREGHRPFPAESAEAGLQMLPMYTFQVAFLDQRLPGMEGLLLGEYLRTNNPEMLIALVTAEDDRALKRRTRQLRVTFIPKPFEVNDIVRAIEAYQASLTQRAEQALMQSADNFTPRLTDFMDEIESHFDIPGVPGRIEDRLATVIASSLNQLRSPARYSESDRVFAFSGLVAAQTLGIRLSKTSAGLTLFEEYDRLMEMHGRRLEFTDDLAGATDSMII